MPCASNSPSELVETQGSHPTGNVFLLYKIRETNTEKTVLYKMYKYVKGYSAA